jgi:uncharacterized protein (DUF885 family)
MKRAETQIDQLANSWVDRLAQMYPSFATDIGYKVGQDKLDDHSPEALAQEQSEIKELISKLEKQIPQDEVDRVTQEAMLFTLKGEVETYDAGLSFRNLNNIASPAQGVRDVFDNSPVETVEDWENLAKRMRAVDSALEGYARTLEIGAQRNDAPALRQIETAITQANQINHKDGFFHDFARSAKAGDQELPLALKKELEEAAAEATAGYAKFAEYLKTLAARTTSPDAIGRERYALLSRRFLGATVDFDETYEWGIEELNRTIEEQKQVANQILPGASIEEAVAHLHADPSTKLHGTRALQEWMQKLSDNAISKLAESHFDIAEPIKKLECMIAPTQHGGIYYTGPSDDFSRPGRMWWSVPAGVEEFDTWRETTTVYHEGVPGHHLQVAQATYIRDTLNAWRRLASWTSGHGEGWALYAERLMAQLGFLDNPADRLGMLDGQRMRAARVVLDIGVHLGKPKLEGEGVWDFDYALGFMSSNVQEPGEFVNFEVTRYFGWPGQAPSYKIGQRIWEQVRDEYAARKGSAFDIKEFHKTALNLGGLGLDTLRSAMARA